MKKMMKKALSLGVAAAMMVGLLAGCGNGSGTTETTAPTEAPAAEAEETAGEAAESESAANGNVTIDVWHSMEGTNGEAFEAMVSNFNETVGNELGITANSVFQGSDCASKLKTLIQAEDIANMPDVCLLYGASLPVVGEYDGAVAVEDMYGQGSLELAKEDVNPCAIETFSYQGKQICMPFNSSTILLYYNKDAFTEVGLDPENPPATWAEVIDACEKLTVKDDSGNVTRYGFNCVLDRYVMVNLVGHQGEGTYFADNESGRAGLITEVTCADEALKVFDVWEKLMATGGFKYTYDNQNEEFATGANAMTLMSSARIGSVTNLASENGVDWGVTYLPDINEGDNGGACIGGASLAMFNNGDDAKEAAAWEFIKYAASAETQSTWSQATGYLPINLGTKSLDAYGAFLETSPASVTALEQFESSNPKVQEPVMMMQGSVDEVITEASTAVCEGTMTPQEAADYMVEEW